MADQIPEILIGDVAKGNGSAVRVRLAEMHGRNMLDVRTFAAWDESKELRPTKKGACVALSQLRPLRALLAKAEAEAVARGWLEPEGGVA